jgi:uncharacterized protein
VPFDTPFAAYALIGLVGLAAGAISGVIGTGSSLMLLPVLVHVFGPKQAMPIMAVAALMANLARVTAWYREIDWRAAAAYSLPGIPAAALGARTLLALPPRLIDIGLGLFILVLIPLRRWHAGRGGRLTLAQMALAGSLIGFLTGLLLSTGPISVPVFMARGLSGGAFIGTEAASSLALYVGKLLMFRRLDALPLPIVLQGLVVGAALMGGTYAGKSLVLRLPPGRFEQLLDGLMLCSGAALLWAAVRAGQAG